MIRSSPEALSRVQFVLCLDDLRWVCDSGVTPSASQRLTLHLSKQPSDPELLRPEHTQLKAAVARLFTLNADTLN